MGKSKSDIYTEEFRYIFSRKAPCVRGALVTAAFIEGQVSLLVKSFLEKQSVKLELKGHLGHRLALGILKANRILTAEESKSLEKFQAERNKSIHGIFKGMTRPEWEQQNIKVVELGRPIVENLDKKLYPAE